MSGPRLQGETKTLVGNNTQHVSEISGLNDYEFREVAKADCFKRVVDDVGEALRSPELCERFLSVLQELTAVLQADLTCYYEDVEAGLRYEDDEWRARAVKLKVRVDARIKEMKSVVRQHFPGFDLANIQFQLRKLKSAIHAHRDSVIGEDYEPTIADEQLWAMLDNEALAEAK